MGVLPLIPRSRLSRFGLSILASAVVLVGALPSPPAVHAAPGPDMVVEKSASVSEVPIDGEITYTITARNVGTEDATGVRIRDTRIDPELIITAGPTATPGMDCRFEGVNNLFCHKRTMAAGGQAVITFTARAPVEACVLIRNRARVRAENEPAANTENNLSAFATVRMTGCPPDTTPPTGSVVINRGQPIAWGPSVLLSLGVSDDRTGDKSILMRISNATSSGSLVDPFKQPYVPSRRWSLTNPNAGGTAGTGPKSVFARFRDRAGNWSAIVDDDIVMRADAPRRCSTAATRGRRALDVTLRETVYPAGDVDWFKFRLTNRRSVVVTLTHLPANFSLALAGHRCGILVRSDRFGTSTEAIRRTLGPGLYFVRVQGTSTATQSIRPYRVRFDTQP
jgi:uncharacterized repeat protein (TIGR01451 family)